MGAQVTFEETMENIAKGFEAVGVAVIVIGGVVAIVVGLRDFRNINKLFVDVRKDFGRPLIYPQSAFVWSRFRLAVEPRERHPGRLPR